MYVFTRVKQYFYFGGIATKGVDVMSKEIKYTDVVPNSIVTRYKEDNIQYLLDQVARLTAENAMLKEKWSTPKPESTQEPEAWIIVNKETGYRRQSAYKPTVLDKEAYKVIPLYTAPPKREPLGLEIMDVCGSEDYREGFKDGALYAEKCHGIGGGE